MGWEGPLSGNIVRVAGRLRNSIYGAVAAMSVTLVVCATHMATAAVQSSPVLVEEPLAAAHRAIDVSDWRAAERQLLRLLASQPEATEPHFLLGYVLFRQQRATESLAAYTAAARLRDPTAEELIVVASDYILLKDYADAERWLLQTTRQAPENGAAWYLLGRTQYNLDHAADAATSFKQCLQLRPDDVRAEYNLGLALEKLDRPAEAEAAYRAAIAWQRAASTRDPQPYLDLGMLLLAQRHADAALPMLHEATSIDPKNALAQQEYGLAYEALGRNAEAVAPLLRAAALAPEAERPHFFLGRVYRRLGRNSEAAAQFAEAQRAAGTHSEKETPNNMHSIEPPD